MTNWFQTEQAKRLYGSYLYAEQGSACSCLAMIQGWGVTKRAIIHGGPNISESGSREDAVCDVMCRMREEARKNRCVYAEVRCYDDYSAYRSVFERAGWVHQPHYDIILDPSQPTPDAKMRQIRAALAEGNSWREAQNEDDVRAFYACLRHLYHTKVHRPIPSEQFFIDAWKAGITVLISEDSHYITGGVFMPIHNKVAYEWYICGQMMSTWAMIEYCREHGIERIDMMGAGEPNVPYGVRDFKLQMGGELKEWGRYICVLKPFWYKLGTLLIK
ncbi:MAG: hypothetical protein MJZ48_01945 [Paludibacteraceae bacterium]|nr:hypothetical protein [Paludibacteraceae bacterium]